MKTLIQFQALAVLLLSLWDTSAIAASTANDLQPRLDRALTIADGLHLWYEIKSDPEDSSRLIVCGTKWDALANTPFGFVYFSRDRGQTWQNVFEDRSSPWVTEHSCAVGPHHRAYFISDSATKNESSASPREGIARLFVSGDGGEHWAESLETGWTDYSTSAVSKTSGRLYTFFHTSWMARDPSRQKGNDLGVLVFSEDGRTVAGPFFSPGTSSRGYNGIYPSNATAVQSGAVLALYYAKTRTDAGEGIEVGVMRAGESERPVLTQTIVAHPAMNITGVCANFDNGSMAYDRVHNKLFLVYTDGCGADARLLLTASEDEGRHWGTAAAISVPRQFSGKIYCPSVAVLADGILGLLWENQPDSGEWLFSRIENGVLPDNPVVLSKGPDRAEISNDSLWTQIVQASDAQPSPAASMKSSIEVNVASLLNGVWRAQGVLSEEGRILAIWSSGGGEGMKLCFGVLRMSSSDLPQASRESKLDDVTRSTFVIYGGDRGEAGQLYDEATSTIKICAALRNRGPEVLRTPVEMRIEGLESDWGTITAVNATRTLENHALVWDVSRFLTGDRIPPGTASNPFCLLFRLARKAETLPPFHTNLLGFTANVFARQEKQRNAAREPEQPRINP